jgi:hypothetical protein
LVEPGVPVVGGVGDVAGGRGPVVGVVVVGAPVVGDEFVGDGTGGSMFRTSKVAGVRATRGAATIVTAGAVGDVVGDGLRARPVLGAATGVSTGPGAID